MKTYIEQKQKEFVDKFEFVGEPVRELFIKKMIREIATEAYNKGISDAIERLETLRRKDIQLAKIFDDDSYYYSTRLEDKEAGKHTVILDELESEIKSLEIK